MPIKWSAVAVSEAMDKVEQQVVLADEFIFEARVKTAEALKIPNLPQYLTQRLHSLDGYLSRQKGIKDSIKSVRKDIPEGAIEAERERLRYGSQQGLT